MGMTTEQGTRSGQHYLSLVDLLILAVGTFTLGVDGYVMSGLLPEVSADLHVSVSTAGQLTSLFAIVYAVGSPIIAALTGNWDRRVLLAGGMAVFISGMILQATGSNFPTVAGGRVVAALGAAAYQSNAFSTAGLLSDDAHRARSLAVVAGGGSLALVAGLPFGILVGQAWGWRSAMWILVVPAVISCVSVAFLPAAHAPSLGLRGRLRVLTDTRVRGILVGTATVMVPAFLIVSFLPTVLHISGTLVVVAMFGFGCGQVLGTAAVPRLIRWRGSPFVLVLGGCVVTVFAVILTLTRTFEVGAVVTMFGLGAGAGISLVPQQHRLFALVPAFAPIAMGLNGSAIYFAAAVGAALGGGVLAVGGASALAPTAALLGVIAITAGTVLRPENHSKRKAEAAASHRV
ncbi:MFS transporter [Nocardia sp. NPDC006630]|uniref:MFS transporter n=1 Tax=Nocardia sp. NPDC006630 TaxID=3157181 RepID=UPI0033A787FC